MECVKCGKFMTSLMQQNLAGLMIQVQVPKNDIASQAFVQRQFGKHKVQPYPFCVECVLDVMLEGKDKKIIAPRIIADINSTEKKV